MKWALIFAANNPINWLEYSWIQLNYDYKNSLAIISYLILSYDRNSNHSSLNFRKKNFIGIYVEVWNFASAHFVLALKVKQIED